MNQPFAYFNGEFLPAREARLPFYDLGIVSGASFTEMIRTFAHAPFRLDDHIERLFNSLEYAGIEIDLSPQQLSTLALELIEKNSRLIEAEQELGIVIFVTAGANLMYADGLATQSTPSLCIHTFGLPFERWRGYFQNGARVVVPNVFHLPPQSIDPRTKHRSRLHWLLADRQTHAQDPGATSLLTDENGFVTECTAANFLVVKSGVITSARREKILDGISLRTVREIAEELGLEWREADLTIEEVLAADEAWLTSTPYCIARCAAINGVMLKEGKELCDRVLNAWSARVGLDIRAQFVAS